MCAHQEQTSATNRRYRRRRTTKALRANDLRQLVEHVSVILYRYRLQPPGLEYINPTATILTGYSLDELYADPDVGFNLVHPDDRPLLEALRRGERALEAPIRLRWLRKDGTVLWTEIHNTPVSDANGKLVAVDGIARDVTEHQRLAEERAQMLAQERTARAHAEAAITIRDAIFTAAAHDLKNSLATVQLSLQVLQRRITPGGWQLLRELEHIGAATRQMMALADELLDVARLQMGQPLALNLRPLAMVALVQQAVTKQQQTTEKHQFIVETSALTVVGEWDRARLERVVDNLLTNAIKYSPEEGFRSRSPLKGVSGLSLPSETRASEFRLQSSPLSLSTSNVGGMWGASAGRAWG